MKFVTILVAMVVALGAAGASVTAQGRGNGHAKKTTSPKPAKTQTRPVKAEARAVKAETRAARTAAKAETRAANTKPNQEARLLARLPPGTNIQDASQGFKNRGQFIAAVNASNNHSIPFYELKARMTGIPVGSTVPTTTPLSLGQALQSFKVTPTTPQP